MHRRAALWFAQGDVVLQAEHLDRAGDAAAPAAYLAAGRMEASLYHMDRARRLIERGLALADHAKDRFTLACAHGDVLRDLGETARSISAFEEASEAATDDLERCQAQIGLARGMRVADRIEEALAMLDAAEAIATALRRSSGSRRRSRPSSSIRSKAHSVTCGSCLRPRSSTRWSWLAASDPVHPAAVGLLGG
jgi:tetratricopeptide (TPR) repeat protein